MEDKGKIQALHSPPPAALWYSCSLLHIFKNKMYGLFFPFSLSLFSGSGRADVTVRVTACCLKPFWTSWHVTSHSCHCFPPSAKLSLILPPLPPCWLGSADKVTLFAYSSLLWSLLSQISYRPRGFISIYPHISRGISSTTDWYIPIKWHRVGQGTS